MFFELVSRNSKRNRKENGLFFSSLLISIVAFYLVLSLSHQDVMRFLKDMESDAVNRLLSMIPLFYAATLLILFFLIYFAGKYQLAGRKHELGMYLMLGMRRGRLFILLLAEDIRNSVTALAIGLPVGIALSELISLVTARLVGIGIIGHRISVSGGAVIWTAAGFLFIKLFAFLILSGRIAHQEIGDLLVPKPEGSKKQLPFPVYLISLVLGIGLLAAAYILAIRGLSWYDLPTMAVTLLSGFAGTLLLFFGIRSVMNAVARRAGKRHKLHTFTFRQLEELVIHKSNVMAVTSMLILAALCCFGSGIAIADHYGNSEPHTIDYTFQAEDYSMDAAAELEEKNLTSLFRCIFEMRTGYIRAAEDTRNVYSMDSVMELLRQLPESRDKEALLNSLGYVDEPYLISLTGYNQLLELAGLPELQVGQDEAAVYRDGDFISGPQNEILNGIIGMKPEVEIAGETYRLTGTVQNTNLVVDRFISLSFALIVPDEVFERLTAGDWSVYVNASLSPEQTEGKSLIAAVMDVNKQLDAAGISYESYLQNMGRKLFYVVAASYITIYLAIVFLIMANTVTGIQFLTQLQGTRRRYRTLVRIGASCQSMCCSAGKQIDWYFGIPVSVAAVSSIFGIRALFTGLLSWRTDSNMVTLMAVSSAMIVLICVVECIYITAVKKTSRRFILSLMSPEREE